MSPLWKHHALATAFSCALGLVGSASSLSLDGLPTVPFVAASPPGLFSLRNIDAIVVDERYANATDEDGSTLILPTLLQFASTFAQDLESVFNLSVAVSVAPAGNTKEDGQLFLTIDKSDTSGFVDAAGRLTSEAYRLHVGSTGITATGASALGVWWATRTVLQLALLHADTSIPLGIPLGNVTDSPGWATRGMMLDVGRHYYPPDFLADLCAYMSFFKQNTLHLHLSDNLWNNPRYTRAEFLGLYARFRLWSDDAAVHGLNLFANESYTRADFDRIQASCAARGVTVLPEIEAPGHALVVCQWKPQLAYGRDLSLLNISHPETIPTMQAIWGVFLPWFASKVVSIGADEYQGPADEYYRFVNTLARFIGEHSGKQVRTWGMFPPTPANRHPVAQNISIQHWEFFEDDAYNDYIRNGYAVVNSNDDFYVVNKYGGDGGYPNTINTSRTFDWLPYRFDVHNATRNPPASNPLVLGAIAALWNDPGPNATVYSEAYYAWREGLPALADKQWGGQLTRAAFPGVFAALQPHVPGQNLERRIPSNGTVVFDYAFGGRNGTQKTTIKDTSLNGYDAQTDCLLSTVSSAAEDAQDAQAALAAQAVVSITPNCSITTPLSSKGRNYTLDLSLRVTSMADPTNTTLVAGRDSALMLTPTLTFFSGGNYYRLPPSSISFEDWVDIRILGRGNQTFAEMRPSTPTASSTVVRQEFRMLIALDDDEFRVVEMALEAPLHVLGRGGWTGQVRQFQLLSTAE
ncbi:hypothetical protein SCUCBS95973_008154 [Sporothrix curviconia]|uniref:beta-N-acetylhexosaminidase n=1 Tax=Sporothrix curviconia TaxID=1260050 RepID=A0ABP0CJI1_9PEZI